MSLLLILMLSALVSVWSQSTLLNSQCDNECFLQGNVEIQRLAAMMEKTIKDMNDRFEKMESELTDQNNALERELQNQNDVINQLLTKISQLESESAVVSSTPKGMDSTTWIVFESGTSEDCEDIRSQGYDVSGVYGVNAGNGQVTRVYCEMTSDGQAWTRILHRQDNLTDFTYKKWIEYEAGFGDPQGSHWMGLVQMHHLTTSREYRMRVDLEDWEGYTRFAEYSTFSVGGGSDKYRLSIGGHSGTVGDSMTGTYDTYNLNNTMFSTIDNDNDLLSGNCAGGTGEFTGGWWYNRCARARLTGTYLQGGVVPLWHGIQWTSWRGDYYSYKVATMKVQRL